MSVVSSWTLKVKSLEQRTHSVTISSDASVQQLKEAIQSVFDIASHRQRLIFQGKVLKDGTQLAEYANLNDGKIIHLVARPIDAPINTANDDPTTNNSRATRSQLLNGLFSPSDGYTIVTVDANISGISDSNSIINSLINGLVSSGRGRGNVRTRRSVFSMDRNAINDMDVNDNQSDNNRNNRSTNNNVLPNILDIPRHPFEAIPSRRLNSDIPSSLIDRNVISAEDRLTRTLIAISNAMTALQTPPSEADLEHPTWTSMANTTPEQNQAFRSSLRVHGTNERAQIGMVLHELTNAMETMSPRLRELAQSLQAQQQPTSSDLTLRLHHMNTIIQTFSMIYHYLGGIITSENPTRRSRGNNRRSSPLVNNIRNSPTISQQQQNQSQKEKRSEASKKDTSGTTCTIPGKRKASSMNSTESSPVSPSSSSSFSSSPSSSSSSSSKKIINNEKKPVDTSIKGKEKHNR